MVLNKEINTSVKSFLFSATKFKSLNLLRDTKTQKRIVEKIGKTEPINTTEDEDSFLNTLQMTIELKKLR